MNRWFFLFLLIGCVTLARAQFRYSPAQPRPGDVVSFTYTPNASLASEANVQGVAVRYAGPAQMRLSQPVTATAIRQGDAVTGELTIPKHTVSGMLLAFRSKANPALVDHNNGHFFPILLYDSTGALLPHALGGQASVLTRTGFPNALNIKPDWVWVVGQYEQEIQRFPANRPFYWADLITTQLRQQKPTAKKTALIGIDTYLKSRKPAPTPDDLANAARLYEQLGEPKLALAARERIKTVDPAGDAAQKARAATVRAEAEPGKKLTAFASFTQTYPTSAYRPMLVSSVAETYFKAGQFRELVQFLGQQPLTDTDPTLLHSFAQQLTDERRGIAQADWLATRALTALTQRNVPKNGQADRQAQVRTYQETLAHAYTLQNRLPLALATYRQARDGGAPANSDPQANERLWQCALLAARADSVLPYIEQTIQAGRTTPRLRSSLHSWQAKRLGSAEKAETYLRTLEAPYRADRRAELAESFVDEPAPNFTLSTLDGGKVSLAALRGKVVVLDFWATWCGPCIMSFPAMRQARDYFKNDTGVQFLFVNTREGGPLSRVQSFMAKQPYTGTVPLDQGQKVADSFGVQGIPTKVIIDPKGRVRYRSIGYSGNADATTDELTLVIEALKQ